MDDDDGVWVDGGDGEDEGGGVVPGGEVGTVADAVEVAVGGWGEMVGEVSEGDGI